MGVNSRSFHKRLIGAKEIMRHNLGTDLCDQFSAPGTDCLNLGFVAFDAHWQSVAFVELVFNYALLALLAGKVLWMPGFLQCLQHLVLDFLLAAKANGSLWGGKKCMNE